MVHVLPWSNLDSLGIGSLFAYLMRLAKGARFEAATVGKICLWVGLPLSLIGVAGDRVPYALFTIGHTGLVLFYGWIVFQAAKGFPGLIGSFLSNKVVVYFGKISYGLYVFHHFAPAMASFLCARLNMTGLLDRSLPIRLLFSSVITIILTMLSWHLFEKPLNDLKRFIPYKAAVRPVARKIETERPA
jgi:peptidoglycan/LPS O-acetylase OafA/YrhL